MSGHKTPGTSLQLVFGVLLHELFSGIIPDKEKTKLSRININNLTESK